MTSGFSMDFSMVRRPKSSTHALEKSFENQDVILCQSFQNLRLGWMTFAYKIRRGYFAELLFPKWLGTREFV